MRCGRSEESLVALSEVAAMPDNKTKPTDRDGPHGANPRTGKCSGDAGHASVREAHENAGRRPPTDTAVKRSRFVTRRGSVTDQSSADAKRGVRGLALVGAECRITT